MKVWIIRPRQSATPPPLTAPPICIGADRRCLVFMHKKEAERYLEKINPGVSLPELLKEFLIEKKELV